ncbi:host attachment protein [uncultured Brevundimonas sp.]|uniref:host attachment family protein n=1 Tax=uncultured Brevundimonas sp. TaxID=213418 RepID=UPI0026380A9A|nr:host attachment protein [uncultured Brevundimonas sp.]
MNLPSNALVAVVDGEKLALFRNSGSATDIQLTAVDAPPLEDRVVGSAGRNSSDANPDNDTQAEDGFAMSVAQALNGWALKNKFDKLVVIAAPKTMGELRKHWHKEVEGAIVGELTKTLTGHSTDEIIKSIQAA